MPQFMTPSSREYSDLQRERNELLEACREARDHLDGSPVEVHEAFAVLDEAIRKAERK